MPAVGIKSLIDGTVLAKDAWTPEVGVVVPAGTVVSRDVVKRLAAAGIMKAEVTEESHGLASMLPDGAAKPAATGESDVTESKRKPFAADTTQVQANLIRVARMFHEFRDDPLMRELCRLAIKCAQERLIRVQ